MSPSLSIPVTGLLAGHGWGKVRARRAAGKAQRARGTLRGRLHHAAAVQCAG